MDRDTQRPTLPCAAARPERIDDRLVLVADGVTFGGSPDDLRALVRLLRTPGGVRRALLADELAERLQEHGGGEDQAAKGHEVHGPSVDLGAAMRESAT